MASMWRRTMLYLGLGPDDEYDDETPDERSANGPARHLPPEPPEPHTGAVRPLPSDTERPREPELTSVGRPRAGVVRPLVAAPASAKPYAVSPTSFNEAQDVADKFLAGTPVIVNLQEVDAELRRRLVDFSSGLCYGLRGQMERVTNGLYLLTPSNVEVSAEERRRLHERA